MDYSLEDSYGGNIAGIDEAGRGPWAGPVVAAAVILDRNRLPKGIDDSKKLSAAKREALFDEIMACAQVGIGVASVEEIDRLNILHATLLAMRRSVEALHVLPSLALVDGNQPPLLPCALRCMVDGDAHCMSIAAASIIAKVTRDRMMRQLAAEFPGYGWERNAGYGTKHHVQALEKNGVTPHHRKSFAPIRALLEASSPAGFRKTGDLVDIA